MRDAPCAVVLHGLRITQWVLLTDELVISIVVKLGLIVVGIFNANQVAYFVILLLFAVPQWIGFAQYTFKYLPVKAHKTEGSDKSALLSKGFKELKNVFSQIKQMPQLKRFLSSYFFYNMGVQTIMVVAVLFARNEIDWGIGEDAEKKKTSALIISILIIQFVGIAGSFLFSWISLKI